MTEWWTCPNDPKCPHPGVLHDYDADDNDDGLRRACCAEGCTCGHEEAAR